MRSTLFALIALSAFAAACHEQKQDPTPDYGAVRAHSDSAHGVLDQTGGTR